MWANFYFTHLTGLWWEASEVIIIWKRLMNYKEFINEKYCSWNKALMIQLGTQKTVLLNMRAKNMAVQPSANSVSVSCCDHGATYSFGPVSCYHCFWPSLVYHIILYYQFFHNTSFQNPYICWFVLWKSICLHGSFQSHSRILKNLKCPQWWNKKARKDLKLALTKVFMSVSGGAFIFLIQDIYFILQI